MHDDPRIAVARLAAALMVTDARITAAEIAAVAGLERLGLGSLEAATRTALMEAAEAPIDVHAACGALGDIGPEAGALVLAVLTDIVISDGTIDPREGKLLATISALLHVPSEVSAEILHRAAAQNAAAAEQRAHRIPVRQAAAEAERPAAPPPAATASDPAARRSGAYAVLGIPPGASSAAVESAYRTIVERYQPAKVIELGPEFAVLAVNRLAAATAAFTELAGRGEVDRAP